MKQNEYNAAEVVEIGKADEVILGAKTLEFGDDSAVEPPLDRIYKD
jgi:hypothetical protein